MPKLERIPTGPFNPFYGCAIMIIIASLMGGFVTWTIYSGLRQDKEIGEFTVDRADPVPVAEVSPSEREELTQKLTGFATAAREGRPASLSLTVSELNALIVLAGDAGIADYRGMVKFTGLDPATQTLLADLCWPLNRLPFSGQGKRYLTGQGSFKPSISAPATFEVHIDTLSIPGRTVSTGFLNSLRTWPWLNLAKVNPAVSDTLKTVTSFEFSPDSSTLTLKTASLK